MPPGVGKDEGAFTYDGIVKEDSIQLLNFIDLGINSLDPVPTFSKTLFTIQVPSKDGSVNFSVSRYSET